MGKPRTLANTVSAGGPLEDGAIGIAEVSGLQAALDAKSSLVSGTAITTNGLASYSFTDIPSGARKIRLMLRGVSANGLGVGTGTVQVQVGTSSGLISSGYGSVTTQIQAATPAVQTSSSDFRLIFSNYDSSTYSGILELSEIEPNIWLESHNITTGNAQFLGSGQIALASELTTIRLFINSGTFDGGTINLMYE